MSKAVLRSVLTLDQQTAGNAPGGLVFKSKDYRPQVRLVPEHWRDLGNPEMITVTIESGDRLSVTDHRRPKANNGRR